MSRPVSCHSASCAPSANVVLCNGLCVFVDYKPNQLKDRLVFCPACSLEPYSVRKYSPYSAVLKPKKSAPRRLLSSNSRSQSSPLYSTGLISSTWIDMDTLFFDRLTGVRPVTSTECCHLADLWEAELRPFMPWVSEYGWGGMTFTSPLIPRREYSYIINVSELTEAAVLINSIKRTAALFS